MAKGVLVDTWIYAHKAIEGAGETEGEEIPAVEPIVRDKKVKVQVRILKETRETDRPPHATTAVKFMAECRDIGFAIEGTDIEALRLAVWSKLDKQYAITWETYYLVRVERPYMSGTGGGVQVSWDIVSKGTAWDGTELLREYSLHRRPNEDFYKISPWPGAFRDKRGKVMACIPATERNKAALEEFVAKLDQLRKLMAEFLSPEKIETTLANLAGVAFLPPADTSDRALPGSSDGEPGDVD